MSVFRLFRACCRLVRLYTVRNEFSAAWWRHNDRASWQSDFDGGRWQAGKLDYETWKPGR